MPPSHLSDATVSIRLIWPFARLAGDRGDGLARLSKFGITAAKYADPDTRIPFHVALELLNASVEASGDVTLGLRAGELVESGDFDALEYAARSAATVREAVRHLARYARVMNDAAELTLLETDTQAIVRYRVTDSTVLPAPASDFMTATLMGHFRRHTGRTDPALEIQFMHAATRYLDEYARVFQTRVTFDAPCNALILPRDFLDIRMLRANPRVSAAFELHVQKLLQKLSKKSTVADKVREIVAAELSHGDIAMAVVARKLAMSVATLRRRLEEEDKSYSDLVDGVRGELARLYLGDRTRAVSEVAFLLGFSDVPSFYKAFKRWTGLTPAEFRTREIQPE